MNRLKRDMMVSMINILNEASDRYYNSGDTIMSDKEFDMRLDDLKQLEKETGVVMSNSPTINVGYEVKSELKKIKHSHPMLSLAKTKDVNDLINFSKRKDCILSLKMDGVTVLLTYDNGVLTKAETRGNGEIGEDITHNAKVFENIPLTIENKEHCEFEGEAIITYDDFEKINAVLPEDEKYKNPRNLVSGSVRQLDARIATQRHIKFIVWKVPYIQNTSMLDALEYASELGFTIVPFERTHWSGLLDDYEKYIYYLKERAKEEGYPIDGMVITYDDISYGLSLGATGHHPKHSLAYKFYDEEVETTITGIDWTMGKGGTLTPTAIFEPVEIDGITVERASVHNVSILTELDLHIGDRVTVYKANMIIPQIRDNLDKGSRYIQIPSSCPICGGKAEIIKNGANVLMCTNNRCKGKLLGKLNYFVSKSAMNINGLSEATLEKFIEEGFIESFIDIYNLKAGFYNDILNLEGFKKRSTDKLMDAIEKSKHTTLDKFINALCIPMIGKENAKMIAKYCDYDITTFIDLMSMRTYEWDLIDGIGSIVSDNINNYAIDYFDDIKELASYMTFEKPESNTSTVDLTGKIFVITGSLSQFENRVKAKDYIESLGGKVAGNVSTKTDYLVNNDIDSNSSKNKKAKELGIKIITEHELINMSS